MHMGEDIPHDRGSRLVGVIRTMDKLVHDLHRDRQDVFMDGSSGAKLSRSRNLKSPRIRLVMLPNCVVELTRPNLRIEC
jgi:hypothetical protein